MKPISIMLISLVILIGISFALIFRSGHLLWTGGNQLGCSDCHILGTTNINVNTYYTCPSHYGSADYFAGCIVETYTQFALGPGDRAKVCYSEGETCQATVQFWGKCYSGYTSNYRCSGNIVQRQYKNSDCSYTWKNYLNCDSKDGCQGTTYYDYYCSGSGCSYKAYPNDSRCVKPSGKINLEFAGAIASGVGLSLLALILILR